MKIIVTGFEDYISQPNPTRLLAESLPSSMEEIMISTIVLPVKFGEAWQKLSEFLRGQGSIDAIVNFGEAPGAEHVIFEKNAYNVRDTGEIIEGGPDKIPTKLPITELYNYFKSAPSGTYMNPMYNDSPEGAYLCNYIFYEVLYHCINVPYRGFVHLGDFGSDFEQQKPLILKTGKEVVRQMALWVRQNQIT
ncbi:MAG: hypothetical protein AAF960_07770 [Bacteroidota bacterium]